MRLPSNCRPSTVYVYARSIDGEKPPARPGFGCRDTVDPTIVPVTPGQLRLRLALTIVRAVYKAIARQRTVKTDCMEQLQDALRATNWQRRALVTEQW